MPRLSRLAISFSVVCICSLVSGCAFDLARITPAPVELRTENTQSLDSFKLLAAADVDSAPCGYDRVLRKDTRWIPVGEIGAGVVYRSPDQLLTFECSNVFEVYIVVQSNAMVGGYMPVEKGYVALSRSIPLVTE